MKVIIIKDCKDGKINEVIDVAAGYATNFLIKKGLALPFNSKTEHMLQNKVKEVNAKEQAMIDNALRAKKLIEAITLKYRLKVTNNVVHGSVTKKHIHKDLALKGVKVESHLIENKKIASIGISKVNVKLYKNISAILKVEVKDEN